MSANMEERAGLTGSEKWVCVLLPLPGEVLRILKWQGGAKDFFGFKIHDFG